MPIRLVEFSPAKYIEVACQRERRRTLTRTGDGVAATQVPLRQPTSLHR